VEERRGERRLKQGRAWFELGRVVLWRGTFVFTNSRGVREEVSKEISTWQEAACSAPSLLILEFCVEL
jgi:hypothetical protein